MAVRIFSLNRYINFTGNIETEDGVFDIAGVSRARIVTEEAGAGNEIEIFVRILGESDWDSLGTITGSDSLVVNTETYDELKIIVNSLDGENISGFKILSTGYQMLGGGGASVELSDGIPTGSGSAGDVVIDTVTDTIYYWNPDTSSWNAGASASPSLTSSYVGYGSVGNSLTGSAEFSYDSNAELLSVPNIIVPDNFTFNGFTLTGVTNDLDIVSATTIATSESIKNYVDAQIQTKDDADEISYDNTNSGLVATNVQDAIDEIESANYVNTFNTRSGDVTAESGDYDADQIDYSNVDSTLSSSNVKAAIDELSDNYDNHVDGMADNHAAIDVTFDNTVANLPGTPLNVQQALNSIDSVLDDVVSDLDTHLANDSNIKHTAKQIEVEVAGDNYTASEVETALSELDDVIGTLDLSPSNYTPSDAAVIALHLSAIDSELGILQDNAEFSDSTFRISNIVDDTKKIAFDAADISTATTRTISMPDANVDLSDVNQAILQDGTRPLLANLDANNFTIQNLVEPQNNTDAARKIDVDNAIAGVIQKDPVRVATTTNIDLATGGLLTVDDVSLNAGDRVLVRSQTDPTENGIYIAAVGAWTRSEDFDGTPSHEVKGGAAVFVNEGTTNEFTSFRLQGNGELTVGVDNLIFSVYSRAESIVAGDGLDRVGLTLSVDAAEIVGSGLEDDGSNNLRISSSAVGDGLTGGSGSQIDVQSDSTGGANLASVINVSSNGVAVRIDDNTIGENASQQLELKDDAVTFDKLNSSAVVTDITATSNDTTIPTTKAVDDLVGSVETDLTNHTANDSNIKHTAIQIDYERADIDRKNIEPNVISGRAEDALNDLDDAIGALTATPSNYSPIDASIVADHLSAIDSALGVASGTDFIDANFRISNNTDATKKIAFDADAITTSNTRTVSIPDADVDLADVNQAILQDGTRSMSANLDMGSNRITNVVNPVDNNDAVNKITLDTELDTKQDDIVTTEGDLIVGDNAGNAARLAIGTNGQILSSNGTTATWTTPVTSDELIKISATDTTAKYLEDAIETPLNEGLSIQTLNPAANESLQISLDLNSVPTKVTPIAADKMVIVDSEDTNKTKRIDFSDLSAFINHDVTENYVANEHIDHTSVEIETSTNSGLSGGGDITTTRSLSVDITNAVSETVADDADLILIYDDSASAHRKITRGQFLDGLAFGNETDIQQNSFTAAESAVAQNVTGFSFANATVRSFVAQVAVEIDADTNLFEQFTIEGVQLGSSWEISITSIGDDSLVVFGIENTGQITYNSSTYTGFNSMVIKYRATTIEI